MPYGQKRSVENVIRALFYFLSCFYFFYVRFIDGSKKATVCQWILIYESKLLYSKNNEADGFIGTVYACRKFGRSFYYTTGSVTYQWVQQSLFLEVEVSPFIFRF